MSTNYRTLRYSNLPELGINPRTGEACAFSMRILCDLNEDGCNLVREFLGLPYDARFAARMNSHVNGSPSIASFMLPRSMFAELYKFALFMEGWAWIVEYGDAWIGMTQEHYDKFKDSLPSTTKAYFNWKSPGQPSVGSRNVHAFTGRHI